LEAGAAGWGAALTVTVTVADLERLPLVPVIVTVYVPGLEELKVAVEVPEPYANEFGLNEMVSPLLGDTVYVRSTLL
jgi:hypothetical protein